MFVCPSVARREDLLKAVESRLWALRDQLIGRPLSGRTHGYGLSSAPARRTEGDNTFNVTFLDITTVHCYISHERNQKYNLHPEV